MMSYTRPPQKHFDLLRLPLVRNRPIRVYLCGPIGKNCWRHRLVPGLRDAFAFDDVGSARAIYDCDLQLPTITAGFACNGPWFVSCDHGCGHGGSTHGVGESDCSGGSWGSERRACVFAASVERIKLADAVFAFFDRAEAYGSAAEIGVAFAWGKPVFAGFSPHATWRDDLWFAAQAGFGGEEGGHVGDVEQLWEKFCAMLEVSLKMAMFK